MKCRIIFVEGAEYQFFIRWLWRIPWFVSYDRERIVVSDGCIFAFPHPILKHPFQKTGKDAFYSPHVFIAGHKKAVSTLASLGYDLSDVSFVVLRDTDGVTAESKRDIENRIRNTECLS